jgi:hypothetical protein
MTNEMTDKLDSTHADSTKHGRLPVKQAVSFQALAIACIMLAAIIFAVYFAAFRTA